jgi:hypothetical protein
MRRVEASECLCGMGDAALAAQHMERCACECCVCTLSCKQRASSRLLLVSHCCQMGYAASGLANWRQVLEHGVAGPNLPAMRTLAGFLAASSGHWLAANRFCCMPLAHTWCDVDVGKGGCSRSCGVALFTFCAIRVQSAGDVLLATEPTFVQSSTCRIAFA